MTRKHRYMEVRGSEYRLQPAMATSLFWRHHPDQSAFIVHEGRAGDHPDLVLLDREGALWLYELKRDRFTRSRAARAICQALLYARAYVERTEDDFADLYKRYMRVLDTGMLSKMDLERYDDNSVLREDLNDFFGGKAPDKVGGRVARLVILGAGWDTDALELLNVVRDSGVAASASLLAPYAGSKGDAHRVQDALADPGGLAAFAPVLEAEQFVAPADWIIPVTSG